MADVCFYRRQLNIQNFTDLRIALIGTQQTQHLQFRRSHGLTLRQRRLQKEGIMRRLKPGCCQYAPHPGRFPLPIHVFQQRQHRRPVDADRAGKAQFRRPLQGLGQAGTLFFVFLPVLGNRPYYSQMNTVQMPSAGHAVGFHRRQSKQCRLWTSLRQLHHSLGKVLVALHNIDV